MHIYLTDKGREYMRDNIIPMIEVESKALEIMPDSEFQNLVDSYKKYIDNFREHVEMFAERNKKA